MPVHALVTGPIRPSIKSVLNLHSQLKRYFPGCITHLVYWSTTESDHALLTKTFDHVRSYPEPSDSFIDSKITSKTTQIQTEPERLERHHYNLYKQTLSNRYMSETANIADSDIVVKLRTDLYLFDVDKPILTSFLTTINPETYYVVSRPISAASGVCDAFGITTFGVYKRVWGITDTMYDLIYGGAFNSENAFRMCLTMQYIKVGIIPLEAIRFAVCRKYGWASDLTVYT
jgi:hypothetical protein